MRPILETDSLTGQDLVTGAAYEELSPIKSVNSCSSIIVLLNYRRCN